MEKQINEKMPEIIYKVNDMILVEWSAFTIKVDENNKVSLDFDYAPWNESDFGPSARTSFFQYKYLGKQPANEKELELFKAMEAFQQEHNGK